MRTRIACLVVALVSLALLAHYGVTWLQVSDVQERGSDFSTYYVAADLIRAGQGLQLYNQPLELQTHLAMLPPGYRITLPFMTPPTSALLALPLSFLDPVTASRLFSVFDLLVVLAALVIAARAAPWPTRTPRRVVAAVIAVAFVGVPTFVLFLLGQLDAICALGLAAGYTAWRRGHRGWAGFLIALGFIAMKPHLAVGLGVFLLARREWRALGGFAAGGALVAAISLPIVGPGGLVSFALGFNYSLATTPEASTLGLPGLVASWLGTGGGATAIEVVVMLAALAGCAALGNRSRGDERRFDVALMGAMALSLAVSPHLFSYDMVSLAPAFVWCMARAAAADGDSAWPGRASVAGLAAWAVGNLIVNADVGNASLAPPGRVAPYALLLAAGIAWYACRQQHATGDVSTPAQRRRVTGSVASALHR